MPSPKKQVQNECQLITQKHSKFKLQVIQFLNLNDFSKQRRILAILIKLIYGTTGLAFIPLSFFTLCAEFKVQITRRITLPKLNFKHEVQDFNR